MNEYYGIQDVDGKNFFQLSKQFFNNPNYQKRETQIRKRDGINVSVEVITETLTDTAKIMYAVFRDVLNESVKNNWIDNKGRIYIKYSVEKLCKLLGKNKETIIKTKKILVENNLLEIVPQGLGKADVFYLKKIKERPVEKIIEEYQEDKTSTENQPVDFSDQSVSSTQTGRNFRPELVGFSDPIKLLNKNNNKITYLDDVNKIDPETTEEAGGDFEKIKILFEQHGIAPDVKVRLMILVKEKNISLDRVTEVLKAAPQKNWGEGAIYRALEKGWNSEETKEIQEKREIDKKAERKYQESMKQNLEVKKQKEISHKQHEERQELLKVFNTWSAEKKETLEKKAYDVAYKEYGVIAAELMAKTVVLYRLIKEELRC